MKALKLIVIVIVLFLANPVQSQISVRLNFGTPPQWGPVGYTHARYYYLPDVQAYYDVQTSMFIYMSGGYWIHRTYLPTRYKNYDLYDGYKVVLTDYRGYRPYANYNEHRMKYARGYRGQEQRSIGQRPGYGNSREKMNSRDNQRGEVMQRSNQNDRQRDARNDNRGNDRKDKNQGHDNGNGKNK